jgi:cysteine desulfurase / selenocysteine lyase
MEATDRSVYLDNAATTYPKPEVVYRVMDEFAREVGGSAGRSGHRRAVETGRMVYSAREALASATGTPDPLRVVFTRNATEAINLAIWGTVRPGSHVVTTSMEHNSVMRPLEAARGQGVEYTVVRCAADGSLTSRDIEAAIRPETALVVMTHASNVTGTIMPVEEVAAMTSRKGVKLLVDAAQTVGRLPVDVSVGIDMLAFSGHKELFGPQGTGALCVGEGTGLTPLVYGGTGSRSSELKQPDELPERFESGTLNAHGIAGLGAGVRFVSGVGIDEIRKHEVALILRLVEGLSGLRGVTIHGPADVSSRIGIVPVTVDGITAPEAAKELDARFGIATRAGLHCAPCAHETIGTLETGALRISMSYMNEADDIDYLLESLGRVIASRR